MLPQQLHASVRTRRGSTRHFPPSCFVEQKLDTLERRGGSMQWFAVNTMRGRPLLWIASPNRGTAAPSMKVIFITDFFPRHAVARRRLVEHDVERRCRRLGCDAVKCTANLSPQPRHPRHCCRADLLLRHGPRSPCVDAFRVDTAKSRGIACRARAHRSGPASASRGARAAGSAGGRRGSAGEYPPSKRIQAGTLAVSAARHRAHRPAGDVLSGGLRSGAGASNAPKRRGQRRSAKVRAAGAEVAIRRHAAEGRIMCIGPETGGVLARRKKKDSFH